MVEVARRRLERSGSGVDPPRRGGPLEAWGPPSSIQPRRVMPRTAPRPSAVSTVGDRAPQEERSIPPHRPLKMGFARLPCSQARGQRMATDHRLARDQQILQDKEDDPSVPSDYYKAQRPLDQLRSKRRLLFLSNCSTGQGGLHGQPRRPAPPTVRPTDGLEPKPFRLPEVH